jgi:sugar phosphate isomerase/epimerase
MKYAICNETFDGWDHARVCARIAELGYTGLEVAPFTLAPLITELSLAKLQELRATAERHAVTIIGTHWLLAKTTGFHLTTADTSVREKTGRYLASLAEATAAMGGHLMVLGSPLQRNLEAGMSVEQADANALHTLALAVPTLERCGVSIAIEPLGPSETNYLNTAAHAVKLIRQLNSPHIRLHLDVKAMSSETTTIPELIRSHAADTLHFHANDPNKRGPGFGDVDFRPIFAALKTTNYDGYVSVEVFDYTPDPDTIARESIRYMSECAQ